MNAILLVLWMQMHIAFALNIWCNIVVNPTTWLFCRTYHYRIPKRVLVSNFRLLRYVISAMHLRLNLKKYLQSNLNKKSKTVILPLQPI